MNCPICKGELRSTETDVDSNWKGKTITFRNIKVDICNKCNMKFYDSNDVEIMHSLISCVQNEIKDNDLMNLDEVAELFRVSGQTIYNMLRDGRLKAQKVGREWRFNRVEIETLLSEADDSSLKLAARLDDGSSGVSEHDKNVLLKIIRNRKKQ